MTWRKIVIEFPDDTLDPEQEVAFLTEHYRHSSGVPTATVTLQDQEPEQTRPDPSGPGLQGTAQALGMTAAPRPAISAVLRPWPGTSPYPPTSIHRGADELVAMVPFSKAVAIKAFMAAYGVKYTLAYDCINAAWKRKP